MDEDTAKLLGVIAAIGMLIAIIAYVLCSPKEYTIKVTAIQWEYGVHIEQYSIEHHTEDKSYPSDAYNVVSGTRTKTKTYTDSDGNSHTKFETYTVYSYDVNRWIEKRCAVSKGIDRNPEFAKYTLLKSERADGIGEERVKYLSKEYFASGPLVGSDDLTLHTVPISEEQWAKLTTNDEVNYLQSKVGSPYAVSIAE